MFSENISHIGSRTGNNLKQDVIPYRMTALGLGSVFFVGAELTSLPDLLIIDHDQVIKFSKNRRGSALWMFSYALGKDTDPPGHLHLAMFNLVPVLPARSSGSQLASTSGWGSASTYSTGKEPM